MVGSGIERGAGERNAPVVCVIGQQVELPHVAFEITRVHDIGAAVAIDVDHTRSGEPIAHGVGTGRRRDDFLQRSIRATQVLDQKHGTLVGTVVAIPHDDRPPSIVQLGDLGDLGWIGLVHHRSGEDVAKVCFVGAGCDSIGSVEGLVHHHHICTVCRIGGEVGCDGIVGGAWLGHVHHEIALAACPQASDQQRAPIGRGAADIHVTGERRSVDIVVVGVIGVGQQGQCLHHALGDVRDLFSAIYGGEPMQHSIVAPHIDHGNARCLGRQERRVSRKTEVADRALHVPEG